MQMVKDRQRERISVYNNTTIIALTLKYLFKIRNIHNGEI